MCPPLIIPLMGALSTGSSAIGLTGAAAGFNAIGITTAAGGIGAGASTAASIAGSAIAGAGAGNLLLAGATVAQGVQARQQAQFQAEVAENNARALQFEAQAAALAGQEKKARLRERTRRIGGSARAGLAAGNVVLGTGTAQDIEEDIAVAGELDQFTLDRNIALQQAGFTAQQQGARASASNLRRSGRGAFRTSLLAGASRLI